MCLSFSRIDAASQPAKPPLRAGALECRGQHAAGDAASILRKLLSKSGDVLVGGKPLRVAGIAVKNQRVRLQRFFEFFPAEHNGLIVIVRADDFEILAVAHRS